MNSGQEVVLQTVFCSDPETETLRAELWLMGGGIIEFWFASWSWLVDQSPFIAPALLEDEHLTGNVTWIANKANDNYF